MFRSVEAENGWRQICSFVCRCCWIESNINSGSVSEEQSGRQGRWEAKKKKYIVLILGVSNNSGNKDREKRSTKANQWRWGLFYVATGHFSAWVMDVSLLRGWWQQHDSKSMVLDILYILYGALSLMLPRGSENQRRFNKENIVVA